MNAQSYLQSYGWTPGTSLGNPLSQVQDSSSAPRLTKRILISAKNNTLGVGRKASNLNHADLWWERAFDVSLKNLDVTKDTSAIPVEKKDAVDNMNLFAELGGGRGFGGTAVAGAGKGAGKRVDASGPLYRYFVKGEGLEGTIQTLRLTTTITAIGVSECAANEGSRPSKKRKRDDKDATAVSKAERKALKAERKQLRAERRAAKTERRRLRAERKATKEEKKKLKVETKAKKKAKNNDSSSSSAPTTSEDEESEDKSGVQSDSGVDMSSDETPTEEITVLGDKKESKKKPKSNDDAPKQEKSKKAKKPKDKNKRREKTTN
ncbi:hypothetical protein H072_9390 [Dactylellina haptotyla CBS 200.50]|uniref:G-patch domain-containing protein n=1 Tax=Dactylellina haptotyla (strain CBS 200.50) TaxID=1284197 RepID=S8A7A7_DACHA|nr:hypothetical protein H072_9390 [Dactylellina haptotyla CBS 200.50]